MGSAAAAAAAAAKSFQSCPTLCDPIDGSPPGSSVLRTRDFPGKNIGVGCYCLLRLSPTTLCNFTLPIPSLWVVPVHQPQASSIVHRTWTGDSFLIYYTCFNAILPNHPPFPSPTESKRLFYTSVSLLLSRIQGYSYHLSKFHIYALVYCIDVFLSGLLHSV